MSRAKKERKRESDTFVVDTYDPLDNAEFNNPVKTFLTKEERAAFPDEARAYTKARFSYFEQYKKFILSGGKEEPDTLTLSRELYINARRALLEKLLQTSSDGTPFEGQEKRHNDIRDAFIGEEEKWLEIINGTIREEQDDVSEAEVLLANYVSPKPAEEITTRKNEKKSAHKEKSEGEARKPENILRETPELVPYATLAKREYDLYINARTKYEDTLSNDDATAEEVKRASLVFLLHRVLFAGKVGRVLKENKSKLSPAEFARIMDAHRTKEDKEHELFVQNWTLRPHKDPDLLDLSTRPRTHKEVRDRRINENVPIGEEEISKTAFSIARKEFLSALQDSEQQRTRLTKEKEVYVTSLTEYLLSAEAALRIKHPTHTPEYSTAVDALFVEAFADMDTVASHVDIVRECARHPHLAALLKERIPETYEGGARPLVDALAHSPIEEEIQGELSASFESAKQEFIEARFVYLNALYDWKQKGGGFRPEAFPYERALLAYDKARKRVERESARWYMKTEEGSVSSRRKREIVQSLLNEETAKELAIREALLPEHKQRILARMQGSGALKGVIQALSRKSS